MRVEHHTNFVATALLIIIHPPRSLKSTHLGNISKRVYLMYSLVRDKRHETLQTLLLEQQFVLRVYLFEHFAWRALLNIF